MPRERRIASLVIATTSLVSLASLACGPSSTPAAHATPPAAPPRPAATTTTITAFAPASDNLRVDKVGMRDGLLRPDGNLDLAFSASVSGPADALFVVSVDARGVPIYGLRADTLVGREELPAELGAIVDTGQMTAGIGIAENGKFVNDERGAVRLGDGSHELRLYVPNLASLHAGSYIRAYARTPDGRLVAGPVIRY